MSIKWRKSWFPVWYAFCPTEADFRRAMAGGGHFSVPYPDSAGCCVAYDDAHGDRRALVTISAEITDEVQIVGLIVHETVHVVEEIIRAMQDRAPSEEFRAYAMQAIFSELLTDLSEYRKRAGIG